MKKWLALLMTLALLCAAAGTLGESETAPDLYDLYEVTAEGRIWIGTAVPIVEGAVLVAPGVLREDITELDIWEGKAFRSVWMALPTGGGSVMVVLYETDENMPGIPCYPYPDSARLLQTGELMVRSGDAMKSRINRAVLDAVPMTWNNREALLLTLSGDTTVGSPLVTKDGELAGIVTAEYAEGVNRYVALTVPEISACVQEAAMKLDGQESVNPPEGYKVTVEGNNVTFDWSGVQLPETGAGETLYHIVADAESSYLNFMKVIPGITQIKLVLTPGRAYISGLAVFSHTPDDIPKEYAETWLPAAEPLTDHGFKSRVFAIGELPEDAAYDATPDLPEVITEELLRSGRACIYSESAYQVDEQIGGCSLLIALTAPDGSNYRYVSEWIYMPEYSEKDAWYVKMADTGLLDLMDGPPFEKGTYELAMYIDGKLADTFSFTLK